MSLRITATSCTNPGLVRERNEDSALVQIAPSVHDAMALLIVADGMGGYKAGDRASALAVETIQTELQPLLGPGNTTPTVRLRPRPETALNEEGERATIILPETLESEHYGNFITRAVRHANEVIVAYGREHRESKGLGSTVTLAVIARNRAYFANVGDSRSYLFRQGELRPITRDHSLVARLVEDGEIEPDEVYSHPKRNLIYRSLGSAHEEVEVDLFEEALQEGDMLFLCSDGLWEKVRAPEIIAILCSGDDLDALCAKLIQRANEYGGEDNITVVLARCERQDPVPTESTPIAAQERDPAEADTDEIGAL